MRAVVLALVVLTSVAARAQGDALQDPGPLLHALGQRWSEVAGSLPTPDGALIGESGTLRWFAEDREVTTVEAKVVDGLIVLVRVIVGSSEGRTQAKELAQALRDQFGASGSDGYYTADRMREALAAEGMDPSSATVDIALRLDHGELLFRWPAAAD